MNNEIEDAINNQWEKKYKDSDGNECSLYQLVKREPEWATHIILHYEQKIKELEGKDDKTRA